MNTTKTTDHQEFIRFCRNSKTYQVHRMNRIVGYSKDKDGFTLPETSSETLLLGKVSLHPEAAAFLFLLEGCTKRLLLYILFFELDGDKLLFKINSQIIQSFQEYCSLFDRSYGRNVIMKALRTLVEHNVATNISRGKYMLNPLITGKPVPATRRQLTTDYSQRLIDKGKDPIKLYYPKYRPSKNAKKTTRKKR